MPVHIELTITTSIFILFGRIEKQKFLGSVVHQEFAQIPVKLTLPAVHTKVLDQDLPQPCSYSTVSNGL